MQPRLLPILIRKEITQFKRNTFLPRLVVMLPIMLVLVMPLVTQMDIKNIHIAVLDADHSPLSMRIESHLTHSDYFRPQSIEGDYTRTLQRLDQGEIDVIVSIPEDFERDLQNGVANPILIVANGVNATKGGQGMQYAVQTITSAIAQTLSPLPFTNDPNQLITIQHRYNPTGNYRHFMLPALMVMLLLLVCCFLPLLNIMTEKERGTIEQINVTPISRWQFTLAKLIPYWVLALILLTFSMLLAWAVYGLSPAGNVLLIYAGALLFSLCVSGFAVAIANISDTMQQAIFVMFFFVMIFLLMSGLFTPVESMPAWAQYLSYIFPPRHVIHVFRACYLKGTLFSELLPSYLMLSLLAVAFFLLATITHKKQN